MLKKMGWEEGDGLGKINLNNIYNSYITSVDPLSLLNFEMHIIKFLRKLDY